MGEAGPEAIMPLSRGSDGKLGVKSMGGQGDIIINTNVTVDSNGSTKSDTTGDTSADSARQLGKMIETKVREVMTSESRQGGQLWRMRNS
jgi:phage-related minor tail protein